MYAQMIASEASEEDPERLAAFEARIDAGDRGGSAFGAYVLGLAFALVASTTAGAAGLWLIARRRIPSLRLSISLGPRAELRRVLSFSVWAFVANAALVNLIAEFRDGRRPRAG